MKTLINRFIALVIISVLFSGCLTVEKKEYTFEITGENSGRLTIRYINIMSVLDDSTDVSISDFDELINSYLYGSEIEEEYPMTNISGKRLYEENGMLCAEVIIDFPDLASVKLHQFEDNQNYFTTLCQCLNSENYESSNGFFASHDIPVVMWPLKTKKLILVTSISEADESTVSLLPHYLNWK